MKKLFSSLLAVFMLLTAISPTAFAASFKIDTTVAPKYEDAKAFSDGLAAVKSGGKWGYIDESGKTAIPLKYDFAGRFKEGVAVVGYYGTETTNAGMPYESTHARYLLYLVDKNGKETQLIHINDPSSVEYSDPEEYAVYENTTPIETASASWACQGGVIEVNGTPYSASGKHIYPQGTIGTKWDFFEMTGPCVDGVIPMCGYAPSEVGSQCFFMDKNGKVTREFPEIVDNESPAGITKAYAPDNGRIVAYYGTYQYNDTDDIGFWDGGWGAMDLNGNWVIPPKYKSFRFMLNGKMFCDGIWTVQDSNNKYGGVDVNGTVVIPLQYDFMSSFSEGMCAVKKNGGFYYIDLSGKTYSIGAIDGAVSDSISAASFFNNGISPVYTASNGSAYCVQNVPKDGVIPPVEGTGTISHSVYFPDFNDTTDKLNLIVPLNEFAVIKENNKYGYARLTFKLDLPSESAMDTWSYDEVCKAIQADLIPNSLQNQYRANITRGEFALLMTEVATTITGKDLDTLVKDVTGKDLDDIVSSYPFADATDRNIIAANALGIVNGYGNGLFNPNGTIVRQDAATMLLRSAVAIKADALKGWDNKLSQANVQFNDGSAFSGYAKEAIEVMASLDIMKGVGNNQFAPTATYTRQQSFMTAYRLMVQLLEKTA